jgi:transposase
MRPPQTFIDTSAAARDRSSACCTARGASRPEWVMVLLSAEGMAPAEIADLLAYDPCTVRRWLHRFTDKGVAGLPDRLRPGRPRLGQHLLAPITKLLCTPGPWTIRRLWRRLGRPALSPRTVWRRTRQVAAWRRPA